MTAAIGKIEVEEKELKPQEIMADWTEYVKAQCMQDIQIAKNVRQKGKSLKGCIGQLLKWSWENSYNVDKDVIKAAGIKVKIVKMGIPGMGRAKKIIMEYYMN